MFDIFNRRKLKEVEAEKEAFLNLSEKFRNTAEQAQNEWKVAQEHNKQAIEICKDLESKLEAKNQELIKLTDEYNTLVTSNTALTDSNNESINSYNELTDKYNQLADRVIDISIEKSRTSEELNEYPEEFQHVIVEQWTDESKLELLDSLKSYVSTKTLQESQLEITEEFSISILKPTI